MPKKSGTKKTATTASVQDVDPLDASLSVSEIAPSVTKTKKPRKPKVVAAVEPVSETVEETTAPQSDNQVVDEAAESPSGQELVSSVLADFSATLHQLTTQLASLRNDFKNISKVVTRELKTASKSSRRKRTGGNKQPSGFVKPTLITDELATFLGRTKGSEMARTEVTKEINQYIRDHKLQDSENGRHINPDKKLSKLLSYDAASGETLTYFNLQKYLSPHFVKVSQPSE